jgi:RNA polymerase sigma-70 factor (ECF subfamily)
VEDADDVTQEVFMRAWIAWDDLHDRNNLSAWLHCVAKNLSIDLLRRRKQISWWILARHNSRHERFEEVMPDTGGISGIAEREHIQHALANIPEGYARALLLYADREVPYYEIATIVGISPTAAATRISRAKGMFMEQYQRLGKENL